MNMHSKIPTLMNILGREPDDLQDLVIAEVSARHIRKNDPQGHAIQDINAMSNWELIQLLSSALDNLDDLIDHKIQAGSLHVRSA